MIEFYSLHVFLSLEQLWTYDDHSQQLKSKNWKVK